MEKNQAIIIQQYPLSETSLITLWCSKEHGFIKTVAKGAKRPKSPYFGKLDLFMSHEMQFTRHLRSDLHRLDQVELMDPRLGIRGSYLQVLAATYFCKLILMVAERETPIQELYELLEKSLNYLNEKAPSASLVIRFENKLCEELGLGSAGSMAHHCLQEAFHQSLPNQRKLLLEMLKIS